MSRLFLEVSVITYKENLAVVLQQFKGEQNKTGLEDRS
jgi:hypothetical protein